MGDILGLLVSLFPKAGKISSATGSSGEIKHYRQHEQLRKVLILREEAECGRHTEGKTFCKAQGELMKPRNPGGFKVFEECFSHNLELVILKKDGSFDWPTTVM